jgi:hypothetical protein
MIEKTKELMELQDDELRKELKTIIGGNFEHIIDNSKIERKIEEKIINLKWQDSLLLEISHNGCYFRCF